LGASIRTVFEGKRGAGDELGFGEPSDLGGSDGRDACWWVATDHDPRV